MNDNIASGVNLAFVDSTGSTNDDILLLAESGAGQGTAICAKHQSKGKGRRGRIWVDEPGQAVLLSVLIRPKNADDASFLGIVASVAVADAIIVNCRIPAQIKWPNDVLVRSKKIAGILAEGRQTSQGLAVAAGIGVNLGQSVFPDELRDIATSVKLSGGVLCEREDLGRAIAENLMTLWDKRILKREEIFYRWESLLYGIGSSAVVELAGESMVCVIKCANPDGALTVIDNAGNMHNLVAADSVTIRHLHT